METVLKKNVIIVGGGFLGLKVAQKLEQALGKYVVITLITEYDYFTFYPHLYASLGKKDHGDVFIPLSHILPDSISVVKDTIINFNHTLKKVIGLRGEYAGDFIILAGGGKPWVLPENACDMNGCHIQISKQSDFINLADQVYSYITKKEPTTLHFHIIGGGITGIEFAGRINYLLKNAPHITYTIEILERSPKILSRLLPETSGKVRDFLIAENIVISENSNIDECKPLFDHSHSDTTFIIWSSGIQNNTLLSHLPSSMLDEKNKKALVNEYLEISPGFYIGGDMASTDHTGLAQGAIRDAGTISGHIKSILKNEPLKEKNSFVLPSAFIIPLSKYTGVMETGNITFFGIFPVILRFLADINFLIRFIKPRYIIWHIWKLF